MSDLFNFCHITIIRSDELSNFFFISSSQFATKFLALFISGTPPIYIHDLTSFILYIKVFVLQNSYPDKKKKAVINIYRINTSKRTLSTLSNEVFTNIKDFFKDKLPTKGSVFTGYLYDFDFTINNVCMIGTDLLDDPTVFQHIVDDKIILAASLSYEYVLSI